MTIQDALGEVKNTLSTGGSPHFRKLTDACVLAVQAWLDAPSDAAMVKCDKAASALMCDPAVRNEGAGDKGFDGAVYGAAHLATAVMEQHRGRNPERFIRCSVERPKSVLGKKESR
jgi:hypothetical protein